MTIGILLWLSLVSCSFLFLGLCDSTGIVFTLGYLLAIPAWIMGMVMAARRRAWYWLVWVSILPPMSPLTYAAYLRSPRRADLQY